MHDNSWDMRVLAAISRTLEFVIDSIDLVASCLTLVVMFSILVPRGIYNFVTLGIPRAYRILYAVAPVQSSEELIKDWIDMDNRLGHRFDSETLKRAMDSKDIAIYYRNIPIPNQADNLLLQITHRDLMPPSRRKPPLTPAQIEERVSNTRTLRNRCIDYKM